MKRLIDADRFIVINGLKFRQIYSHTHTKKIEAALFLKPCVIKAIIMYEEGGIEKNRHIT